MNCLRCGKEISWEDIDPERCTASNYYYPFCHNCFYTCPICHKYEPATFRHRIIKSNGTHHSVEEIVCIQCGKKLERNRYKEEIVLILSSGLMLDHRKEKGD